MEPPLSTEDAELIRAYNKQLGLLEEHCLAFDEVAENMYWLCVALEQRNLGEVRRKRVRGICKYIPGVLQRERAIREIAKRCYIGDPPPPPPDVPDVGDERIERSA